ncbi:hypothetical protein LEP1GSC058_1459 [Leptospira fainei serovar Hurstbridge str. BUT 6]|uniref:Uncharacterized protein n=1 Tax=Leptospira fainei serovar Hurstbridge str. BUT 6 TaxID=1193011 RepID=S3V6Y4_9LEPT|nr:hypothetical protein LEP1GSC058_1459 [Leptospira fainei serovar Hurstbridge str. BUT 6]
MRFDFHPVLLCVNAIEDSRKIAYVRKDKNTHPEKIRTRW